VPEPLRHNRLWTAARHTFPGLGKEFMPPLDEGSFLYMPTTMPHASIGEALDILQKQDMGIRSIPEVESVVGKIGRVESALDPAPIGMIETVINYKSEYVVDKDGRRVSFRYDRATGEFARDAASRIGNGETVSGRRMTSGEKSSRPRIFRERPPRRNCSRSRPALSCCKAACGRPWA
jgi:multidrug efflux pump subunit AcrB